LASYGKEEQEKRADEMIHPKGAERTRSQEKRKTVDARTARKQRTERKSEELTEARAKKSIQLSLKKTLCTDPQN